MNARLGLLLSLLLWPAAVRAQNEAPAAVEDACYNELGILCRGAEGTAALGCLERYAGSLTAACKASVAAERAERRRRVEAAAQARAAAAAVAAAGRAAKTEIEARLVKLAGAVYVHTSRQPAEQYIAAEAGMPLEPGDIVRTGSDGSADVALDGDSLAAISADSDLLVKSLEPADAELYLGLGRLVAKIHKLSPGQRLRFVTPAAAATVRGTELAVAQPEGALPARVAVLDEGRVEVTRPEGGQAVVLAPNQETEVVAGKPPSPAKPLAALLSAKSELGALRGRLAETRRQWKAQTPVERATRRVQLAQKPALPGMNLPHVGASQRQRSYPELQGKR